MTATTLAIALVAPFIGAVADVLGRKRVIVAAMLALTVPTVGVAFAPNLDSHDRSGASCRACCCRRSSP